jgi:cytochrome c-type biogenesis protein CcmH/NrfG
MGWAILIALACAVFGALILFAKLPRKAWEPLAATLVLGMAGYAWQGRPSLPDAPAQVQKAKGEAAAGLIEMRAAMDARFSNAKSYLITSDAFSREGNYRFAALYLQSGLRRYPDNAELWGALGLQLMLASEGTLSVPAKFAFDRARALNPKLPTPGYFEGLSALFDGRPADTVKSWQAVLAVAPDQAEWKPKLERQLNALTSGIQAEQKK